MTTGQNRSATPARTSAPARVRIIGGAWKRTPLAVIDVPGLRPTPDRVRETLFNWLGGALDGWHCLDLFAGTGALGLEAASRGAAEVMLVEQDARALRALREAKARLHAHAVQVIAGDAAGVAQRLVVTHAGRFDVVFLDPPFGAGWPQRIAPIAARLIAPGGYLYLEAEAALDPKLGDALAACGLHVWRAGRAGQVHYHLLRQMAQSDGGA